MIVYATKVTVKKAIIGVLVLCAVIGGIALLTPRALQTAVSVGGQAGVLEGKLKTNEDRVALLRSLGWEVNETPTVEMEVEIPKTFDAAYQSYNELQKRQGLDLEKYAGKRATLYTYTLTAYPGGKEGVTASLLLYKNRLVAADISAAEADGFTHGITEQPYVD